MLKLPISLIGCLTPISLLTAMIDTNAVSVRIADFNSSKDIMPVEETGKYVISKPSPSKARHESKTHLCSYFTSKIVKSNNKLIFNIKHLLFVL